MKRVGPMRAQRGSFVLGLIVGLLLGLALALGVALYITKAPVPFINKVPQRTAEQDQAEQTRNRSWDPNAPLAGKPRAAGGAASGPSAPAAAAASAPGSARDPAAILSGPAPQGTGPAAPPAASAPAPAPGGVMFFVQAGAFARNDEAEQQRARLAMLGYGAKISEREQHGRVVYRVRMGPYATREEAESQQSRLLGASIESQLVRVERP